MLAGGGSLLGNLDPLSDIFNGNPTAAARWASNLTNSMLPLGGQRNELGRAMYPMLKELDNDKSEMAGDDGNDSLAVS